VRFWRIVLFCTGAAIVYGWAHDLVTANFYVPYFSVYHPDIFHTTNPWLLALGWGVVATWWMGALFGFLLALASTVGGLPKLDWRDLRKPVIWILASCYVLSFSAGGALYLFVMAKNPTLKHPAREEDIRFFSVWLVHNCSYTLSAIGAVVLCVWAILRRIRMERGLQPATRIPHFRPAPESKEATPSTRADA